MPASDQLTRLAARAKEAEDRGAAAQGKAKADLEQDVATARASAQAQADKLRQSADASKGKLSVWWHDVQRSWNEHVAKVREDIDAKRAENDAGRAQLYAENAEDDATFAVEYAYAAIEEAEYAVLDAALARKHADELSPQGGGDRALPPERRVGLSARGQHRSRTLRGENAKQRERTNPRRGRRACRFARSGALSCRLVVGRRRASTPHWST